MLSLGTWTPGMLEADQAKRSAVIGFASGRQCSLWGMKAVQASRGGWGWRWQEGEARSLPECYQLMGQTLTWSVHPSASLFTLALTMKCTNLGLTQMPIGEMGLLELSFTLLHFRVPYQSSHRGPLYPFTDIWMSSLSQAMHKDMTVTESSIVPAFLELMISRECALGERA